MKERLTKDVDYTAKGKAGTADILAFAGVVVCIIIAVGIVMGTVDAKFAAAIILAICGGIAIGKVINAKRSSSEENMEVRPTKDVEFTAKGKEFTVKGKVGTEDILAFAGLVVCIIIAFGIIMGVIDGSTGAKILIPIGGGSAIAMVINAKRSSSNK